MLNVSGRGGAIYVGSRLAAVIDTYSKVERVLRFTVASKNAFVVGMGRAATRVDLMIGDVSLGFPVESGSIEAGELRLGPAIINGQQQGV